MWRHRGSKTPTRSLLGMHCLASTLLHDPRISQSLLLNASSHPCTPFRPFSLHCLGVLCSMPHRGLFSPQGPLDPCNPGISPTAEPAHTQPCQPPTSTQHLFFLPGSLLPHCRASPALSCAAHHSDSWIAWSGAMQRWLTLAASSWTTSRTGTSCVSSTR